ncbi:MAG TPA: zinc-binding dehydrogenase [Gemmatimonadales bacterium]|jgi:6-hydroxycyclohex-1-ene-1-carbonyl-CoA dehydrogenase
MKAAVFHGPDRPLEVTDVPTPEPDRHEVLVRVAGCGMCHTDLHYIDHGVQTFKSPPIILGHEAAGTIAELGEAVTGWAEGDRVLIPAVLSCGRCPYCREGRENLCDNLRMLGNHMDGAYAEFVRVPADELIRVPASLPLEKACVVADALSTPYHAVTRRARVRAGEQVAVVGCGGVGLNVVQCAVAVGATVTAIDVNEARLEIARELGASETINPKDHERLDKVVRKRTDGGVSVAFEAIGSPATIRLAFNLLRRGGRLCVIGFSHEEVSLAAGKIMFYELEVIGSLGCGGGTYPEILSLLQAGRLQLDPVVSGSIELDNINTGFDRLRRGEGVRWVVTP